MSSRSYLSIGDVLTLLRQEFPDVTISKIRFLESQGLVNPERTPSGYRKFYEHDVERLRWVLRQQREHFLPLKVIKDRLDDDGGNSSTTEATPTDGHRAPARPAAVASNGPEPGPADAASEAERPVRVSADAAPGEADPDTVALPGLPGIEPARRRTPVRAAVASSSGAPAASTPAASSADRSPRGGLAIHSSPASPEAGDGPFTNGTANGTTGSGPSGHAAAPSTPPAPRAPKGSSRRASSTPSTGTQSSAAGDPAAGPDAGPGKSGDDPGTTIAGMGGASLSLEDLCSASGLSAESVGQLQEYGLVVASVAAGVEFFDEEALAVANLAAKFASFGIEARHLRLYKNAADREAGFIEQIVIPMVRQRNPEARARANQTADELSRLGLQMKASLLRTALRDIL